MPQRMKINTHYATAISAFALCAVLCTSPCVFQTAATAQQPTPRGVIRLRVRPKVDGKARGLARKRFFLVRGGLAENAALVERVNQRGIVSRDCFYREAGASEQLVAWLKEGDCESVYCREVEPKFVEGAEAVPEFQRAVAKGRRAFGSADLARRWLAVNLSKDLASGFYVRQRDALRALVAQGEARSQTKVESVMTDRNGTAYFTDLEPGDYTVSNLVPAEVGGKSVIWNCEIKVKPGDLAPEKPFTLSNEPDKNVKCVGVEQPPPPCATARNVTKITGQNRLR